jgi:hypothetical protein
VLSVVRGRGERECHVIYTIDGLRARSSEFMPSSPCADSPFHGQKQQLVCVLGGGGAALDKQLLDPAAQRLDLRLEL